MKVKWGNLSAEELLYLADQESKYPIAAGHAVVEPLSAAEPELIASGVIRQEQGSARTTSGIRAAFSRPNAAFEPTVAPATVLAKSRR